MKILSFFIFLITTIPVSAQQWVWDEIAEEHDSSESIPTWLVGILLIIGFFIYNLQHKDDKEQEKRIKEHKHEEEQQLEEELQEYRGQHEDNIDFYKDDDNLIIPNISSSNTTSVH